MNGLCLPLLLSCRGVRGLAKLLNGHSKIKSLCLANNQIAEIGAQALGKALRGNIYVTTLDLRLNNLGDKGVHVLFKEVWSLFIHIYFSFNYYEKK